MDKNLHFFRLLLLCIFFSSKVLSVNANEPFDNPPPPLAGSYTIGAVASSYTTIGAAMNALAINGVSGPVVFLLNDAAYSGETWPINLNAITGASSTNTITIRPNTSVNASITGNRNGDLFVFNSSPQYFIFEGINGAGTSVTITNSNTGNAASVFEFNNGARNNILRNLRIRGATTGGAANGVINFLSSTTAGGNSDNTIANCTISDAGAGTPRYGIYANSSTTAGFTNLRNTFSNNNFENIFDGTSDCFNIFIGGGSSNFTVSGNSFYQTAARVITNPNVDWNPIYYINRTSGVSNLFDGNYFGGTAPNCGGGKMVITGVGAIKGINFKGSSGLKSIISNNVFRNIDFTTGVTDVSAAFYHSDGNVDIIDNIVGTLTTTDDVIYRSTYPITPDAFLVYRSGSFDAILAGGAIGEAVVTGTTTLINNNTIGGIQCLRSVLGDVEFRAVDVEGLYGSFTVTNNTVGGTVANSISNNSNNSTLGIIDLNRSATNTHIINDNIVRNITGTFAGNYASVNAIKPQGFTGVTFQVRRNTVLNISSNYQNPGIYGVVGISATSGGSSQEISNNTIDNIIQTNSVSAAAGGILFSSAGGGTHLISNNIVRAVNTPNLINGSVYGVDVTCSAGTLNVWNNMIVIGYKGDGTSETRSEAIIGLFERSNGGNINIHYNSIHIGGTGVNGPGSSLTHAFLSTAASGIIRRIQNNLFVSTRAGSVGTNIAHRIINFAGATSSGNNIFAAGAAFNFLAANSSTGYNTITSWYAANGVDRYSVSSAADFFNPVSDLRLTGSPSDINFIISNEGDPLTSITTDFYGNPRNAYTPDPGFHEYTCRGCWVGKNSTVWQTSGTGGAGGNWEDGFVPLTVTHAKVMDAPNQPTINLATGTATVNDLYLKTPAYLTLSNVTGGLLQVYRNFNNRDGLINGLNGVMEMKGTAAQLIPGALLENNALRDLIVSNTNAASGVSLGGQLDIYRSLTYSSAGLRFNTNDSLTLKSTAAFTAFIGDFTGKTFTGKTTIERYLRSYKSWRFLSTPIEIATSPSIRDSWQEGGSMVSNGFGTQITGVGPGAIGMDQFTPFPSMKSFDPVINNYVGITNTNDPIANKAGYYVFVRGDRAVDIWGGPTATNLRIKGDILRDNQVFNVPATKFASFGNPYPAQIDFRTVLKTSVVDQYMLWNPAGAGLFGVGEYETYVRTGGNYLKVPGGTVNNFIESGQAVFLQNNLAPSGTITVRETDKSTGSNLISREDSQTPEHSFFLDLYYNDANGQSFLEDGVFVGFARNQSKELDNSDVVKILNTYNNLSVNNNNRKLTVERRPLVTEADTIYLNLEKTTLGKYTFEVKPSKLDYNGLEAIMYDKFTNAYTALSTSSNTRFDFDVNGDAASKVIDRFKIVFTQAAQPSFAYIKVDAARNSDKSIKVDWSVENEYPIANYEVERSDETMVFNKIDYTNSLDQASGKASYSSTDNSPFTKGTNYYRIKATSFDGQMTYSNIVKVEEEKIEIIKPQITVYPNPIKNSIVNLSFIGQTAGRYSVVIYDNSGKVITSSNVIIATAQQTVKIAVHAANAIYTMTILKPDGTRESIKVVIQ